MLLTKVELNTKYKDKIELGPKIRFQKIKAKDKIYINGQWHNRYDENDIIKWFDRPRKRRPKRRYMLEDPFRHPIYKTKEHVKEKSITFDELCEFTDYAKITKIHADNWDSFTIEQHQRLFEKCIDLLNGQLMKPRIYHHEYGLKGIGI